MKSYVLWAVIFTVSGILFPGISQGQPFTGEIQSLQSVLDKLYSEMLPLCNQLIGIGRGLAGFAALWYIGSRVWRSIASAEPIDFYPLLRPFALGMAILLFPYVIALMNGVLRPTVTGTAAMVKRSNNAIAYLLAMKEDALKTTVSGYVYGDEGDYDKWYRYTHPEGEEESGLDMLTNGMKFFMARTAYTMKHAMKQWMSEILQVIYEAAALCLNTLRTFYLIVLAILGPIVFGLSVFDGLQNTLTVWIARYINVFLWLPVANIFGSIIAKIQENMLRIDIEQIHLYGDTFFSSSDTGYIIFLIIGIIGYFTVPSVANYIVHAGGANVLLYKSSNVFTGAATAAVSSTAAGAMAAGKLFAMPGPPSPSQPSTAAPGTAGGQYMRQKLSGNKQ